MAQENTTSQDAENSVPSSEDSLFTNAPIGIIITTPYERILSANPAMARMFGYESPEELIDSVNSITTRLYADPSDREELISLLKENGEVVNHECRGIRRDGDTIWVSLNVSAVRDKNGKINYFQSFVTDITQRKVAWAALEKSEDKYKSIFHESPLGIVYYDANGVIVDGNQKFFEIVGFPGNKLIGLDMLNQLQDSKLIEEVKRSLTTGVGHYEDHYTAVTSGKTTPVRILFKGMRNDRGEIYGGVGLIEDITEKTQLEEQLRQSQKMEAIGRLAGGVAHDFNNLLSIINGYCELILHQIERDGPFYHKFSQILKAGEQAASLTSQLLAFSRKQILNPEVIHVNNLLQSIENMLRRLIGEDLDLAVRYNAHMDRIKADPGQLEQVLINLAINARDAMPGGGSLTIETCNVYFDADYEEKHADSPAGDYVMIGISDTGAGMDKETLQHIFDPFYTTKEIGKGTGLGLSTVYGIIKQSGGTIHVYSEPGRGSTFKIYLPMVDERNLEIAKPNFSQEDIAGNETVLVVEDDETVRDMTIQVLEELGYTALGAADGTDALKLIADHHGPIDLMLTDVIMPQMNGRELAEEVSRLYPDIRVIYLSGYTENAIAHHGVLEEGMDFLQKPFKLRELAKTVREVLDRP